VLFVARIVGRRELSSMQPFDLILLVMIGDLVQQGITQNDFSVTGLVLAAGTIAVLAVAVSYGGFRLPWLRPVLEGEPVIVLQDGAPVMKNLDRNRITVDELRAAARLEGIARLADVEWAVLETGGRISFIERSR
ncbi:MAG TPA: YetF domain-containing protein, partial [Labilithrix sp.]|nr:YetF domain-containing protein [Labilithrix sp.]